MARGWPRRAEDELKQVEGLEPRSLPLEIQQGYVAQELQEWRQLDLLADDVIQRAPESVAAQQLERSRRIHHMSELRISGNQGIDSDGPVSGSHDFAFTLRSIRRRSTTTGGCSPAGIQHRPVRRGQRHQPRSSAGAECARAIRLEAEVANRNYGHGNELGLRLSSRYDLNDQWRLGGSVARLSAETPLRALTNGISANGGNLWLRWQQNESRELRASVAPSHFGRQQPAGIRPEGRQRLLAGARYRLDMNLTLSGSRNSRERAVLQPEARLHAAAVVNARSHPVSPLSDRVESAVPAGAGSYWQRDYARKPITQLGYGQRISWSGCWTPARCCSLRSIRTTANASGTSA